jgi:HEAT repeat protein
MVRAVCIAWIVLAGGCRPAEEAGVCAPLLRVAGRGSCHLAERRLDGARAALAAVEPASRAMCLRALAGDPAHDPGVAAVLVAGAVSLRADPDATVRAAAISSLTLSPPAEAVAVARAALGDPAPVVRAAALGVLARQAHAAADAVAEIEPLLADPDAAVRGAAASALGACRARASAPRLAALLADPERDVRVRAAYALRALDRPRTSPEEEP